ncbi:uncharacterized protein [Typha latifolia]|uniref:uncharacterized protein isoform X1 n=2 Tax=Typha latifolia TaxID=4733 RepID=UPI003C2E3689
MGEPKLSLVAISSMLLLLSSAKAVFDSGGEKMSGDHVGSSDSRLEWLTLTKRNFSSQIRLHPNILIVVTVPWSGESRSLMKEIKNRVVVNREELGLLRLMVVYRNSEKMLADVLGASKGINILYYHHSMSYKYHGRLRAQKILSSILYIMSLKHEEVPLKSLNTQEDLENFLQSTDRSVLLLEFCGWSAKLSHKKSSGDYECPPSLKNHSQNVDTPGGVISRESDGQLELLGINEKVMDNEELTYGVEDLLTGSPWKGGFTLANQSVSQRTENKDSTTDTVTCTLEEFRHFESFYTKFAAIAREHFLPPERQRFALVSERSLLPFLDVYPEKWLLVIKFSGCPSCSVIVEEGDDLRTILQDHQSLVKELDVDGNNVEAAFPANRPSVILFVDRSSELSKVQEESKLALEVLRRFAWHNQLTYQMDGGVGRSNSATSLLRRPSGLRSKSITDPSNYHTRVDHQDPKIMKIKENMAIMIVNNGETISLKNTDHDNKGNSLYDILTQLLHQAKPTHETKEAKMSLLAKEVGFQLLSDDFDVQVVDSLPTHEGIDQSSNIINSVVTNAKDKTSEILEKDFGHSISTKNDDLAASDIISVDEGEKSETADLETDLPSKLLEKASPKYVDMNNGDLVDATGITEVDEGNKPEHTDTETNLEEQSYYNEGSDCQLADTLAEEVKGETSSYRSMQANGRSKSSKQEKSESFIQQYGKSFQYYHKSTNPAKDTKDHVDNVDGSLEAYPNENGQNSAYSLMSFDGDGAVLSERSMSKLDDLHDERPPFVGSLYFSDGGYRLLRALTAGSKIPSLVILDPIQQQHFVFPEEADISYLSVVNFVDKFLNGSLTPYQHSASSIASSKDSPRPPFVNLDLHEANSIPQVTASTFCELVMGFRTCEVKNEVSFINSEIFLSPWKIDVLVLFSSPWCGFCQRMELIVREVYRTFKSFMAMSNFQSKDMDPLHMKDKIEEFPLNGPPLIYLMDCTQNDCYPFLRPKGMEELYPTLLLFPAENKTAISYEGDMSVINIFEFLESHGSNVHYLNKHKGFLWTQACEQSKKRARLHDISVPVQVPEDSEIGGTVRGHGSSHVASHVSDNSDNEGQHVVVGSILTASYKLVNAVPFDNSTVLIVSADRKEGFHGVIINKRISWEVFKDSYNIEALRNALLFYGGPVSVRSFPLVSLAHKAVNGYIRVTEDVYFGNPVATSLVIKSIRAGDQSANDFWFFFGYSSWGYNQLFDELNEGAWDLSEAPVEHLDWPHI